MKIVLKIGGSLLYRDDSVVLNDELIKQYVNIIKSLSQQSHQLIIVTGGGKLARQLIKVGIELKVNHTFQDVLGVEASRIHAMLFIGALSDIAYRDVPRSFNEVRTAISSDKIIVLGGLQPGQSTNAVASLIAEFWDADLIVNLSDVDKVYDKDPDKHPDAKAYDKLSIDDFYNIIVKQEESPGRYPLYDRVGAEILKRSRLKIVFLNGRKPENIEKAIKGENVGTIVC